MTTEVRTWRLRYATLATEREIADLRRAGRELADAVEELLCAGGTPRREHWHRVEEALTAYGDAERRELQGEESLTDQRDESE